MNEGANVWKLYAIRFFFNLIPAYVIERLYWEAKGMSILQVVYTEIIYALSIVLLELPTGILADRWGRKKMLILAALMGCCEFLLLIYANDFWDFALVVFLAAIGSSAISGAEDAMLYDSLSARGQQRFFEKHLGRLQALDISSTILAALCGSVLAHWFGFTFTYWISFFSMLAALCLTVALVEPHVRLEEGNEKPTTIGAYLKVSLLFFKKQPGVFAVVLSGMVTGAAIAFIDEFWQTYLDRLGIPVLSFGLFSAAIFLVRIPGSLFAYKLAEIFPYRQLLLTVTAHIAVGFFYLFAFRDYSGLAAMILICMLSGVIEPLAAGYLHHRIDNSHVRATIGSFQSLGENAVLTLLGAGFGYFSVSQDIFGGFGFLGVVSCLLFLYLIRVLRKIT